MLPKLFVDQVEALPELPPSAVVIRERGQPPNRAVRAVDDEVGAVEVMQGRVDLLSKEAGHLAVYAASDEHAADVMAGPAQHGAEGKRLGQMAPAFALHDEETL